MKPIHLTARGYRSFADLDYQFADGATAVVGTNGAGKSTLIGAVEVALFGPRSRSLEPLVREGENELQLCLEFEHAHMTYRVRRGWKNGKSSLDFEVHFPHPTVGGDVWTPKTQGNAADTQALLEQTIGLNRTTFNASGYLAQRASDTFTGAQPRDRKRILSDALALDQWQTDAERVAGDRRTVEKRLAEVGATVDGLAERAAQADALTTEAGDLRVVVDVAEAGVLENTTAAEDHARRAGELDQAESAWKVATANHAAAKAALDGHNAVGLRATAARGEIEAVREELVDVGPVEDMAALEQRSQELAAEASAYQQAVAVRNAAIVLNAERGEQIAKHEAEGRRLRGLESDMRDKAAALAHAHDATCDRCEQTLPNDARVRACQSMISEADEYGRHAATQERAAATVERPDTPAEPIAPDTAEAQALARRIATTRENNQRVATLQERIAGLERTIADTDTEAYRHQTRMLVADLAEAEESLAGEKQPEPGAAGQARAAALQAKAQAEAHASRARTASERLAVVGALLEQAQAALVEHAAAVAEHDRLHAELDVLTRLEQAFGRDGIPAWIVESQALPQIETEANRILARLGGAISRVELRTERETKTGEKRDALDIVCLTEDGERALETFSGGEQSRAEISLALGLVGVLQSRRDADLRYLALDEPAGLDSQGTSALAEILVERANGSVVLLASHDANLRDAFDQSIVVTRGHAGSVIS